MSAVLKSINDLAFPPTPCTDALGEIARNLRIAREREEADAWAAYERRMQDKQDAARWVDDDENDEVAA